MAEYTFNELKHKKIDELREIASRIGHEAVEGYTQLRKEDLVRAICTALGIDMHEHHEVKGLDKRAVKSQIRELKVKRSEALEARDHDQLKQVRREIHRLKHQMRKAMV